MSLPRLVAFSASTGRPSRTRSLVEAVAAEAARHRSLDVRVFDLIDAGPGLAATSRAALPLPAARIVEAIESADALVVGTPVHQGSYSGLFKHVFDFVDPAMIAGKPVALTATGGGLRHALVVEHGLRPLFGFFAAHIAPTAVYAGADEVVGGAVVDALVAERVAAAGRELSLLIGAAMPLRAHLKAAPAA